MALSLFDFTSENANLSDWIEQSDGIKGTGESKSVFVSHETKVFRRAVLFTLLSPHSTGECFTGYRTLTSWDLSNYNLIKLRVRGHGAVTDYKVILQHKGQNDEPFPTYETVFHAPVDKFEDVTLGLSDFAPSYRGRKLDLSSVVPLDLSNITSFEIQTFGGLYSQIKQTGISALDIEWIKAF